MSRSFYARLHRRFGPKLSGKERYERAERAQRAFRERLPYPLGVPPERDQPSIGWTVAVVGGGFAGLCAAMQLLSKRYTVRVFEAGPVVGGRVSTVVDSVVKGRLIEAGAELIGANHHHWIELANDPEFLLGFSVLTSEDQFGGSKLEMPIYLDGKLQPPEVLEALDKRMTAILKVVEERDAATIADADAPWDAEKASTWDGMSVYQGLDEIMRENPDPIDPLVWKAFDIEFENNQTVGFTQQSYLSLLAAVKGGSMEDTELAYWTETEVYRCERGNQALATAMASRITPQLISLNDAVTRIDFRKYPGQVEVTAMSGAQKFDYVVLAVPPTVWHRITFTDAPPGGDIGMGPAVKFLSPVKRRFWITDKKAPSGMSETLGMTWEGTDNQIGATDALDLSVFSGGRFAVEAMQHKSNPQQYYESKLVTMFPSYPQSVADFGRFVNWPEEHWIGCGYSCPRVRQVMTSGKLLNQMFLDRLAFAGEHTSMAYFGYMEGALQSGYLAAERIDGKARSAPRP